MKGGHYRRSFSQKQFASTTHSLGKWGTAQGQRAPKASLTWWPVNVGLLCFLWRVSGFDESSTGIRSGFCDGNGSIPNGFSAAAARAGKERLWSQADLTGAARLERQMTHLQLHRSINFILASLIVRNFEETPFLINSGALKTLRYEARIMYCNQAYNVTICIIID